MIMRVPNVGSQYLMGFLDRNKNYFDGGNNLPFAILVHSHLGLEWGATAAGRFYHEEDDEGGGERQRHFNPRQANIIVCDEDPTVSLVEEVKLCEENGWEALPLAAKELTRLFPELWATGKAAEDWFEE